jgi:hypothetical protein
MQDQKWVVNGVEFGEGDKVKVARIEEDFAENGMGEGKKWNNTWAHAVGSTWLGMDGYLGLEFVIASLDDVGVYFELPEGFADADYGSFAFPLTALDLVAKAGSFEAVEAIKEDRPFADRLAYFENNINAVAERIAALQEDIESLKKGYDELKKVA